MTVAELTRKTTDDIPHTTPIERHVDNLLFHRGQTPLVLVLYEENGARTRTIVTAIALRPMGLLPELHHIDTVTLGTLPVDKCHTPFPSSLRNYGVCAPMISEDQLN